MKEVCVRQYILYNILFMLICGSLVSGCLMDDDSSDVTDSVGYYSMSFSGSTMSTYPTGGSVIIVKASFSEDFEGEVHLRLEGAVSLNHRLSYNRLSKKHSSSDIIIYPDSLISNGEYTLTLFHSHGDTLKSNSFQVTIYRFSISDRFPELQPTVPLLYNASQKYIQSFIELMEQEKPEYGFRGEELIQTFRDTPMPIGGSGRFISMFNSWEVRYWWGMYHQYYLLRKLGGSEPVTCFLNNRDGLQEVDIDCFEHPHLCQ